MMDQTKLDELARELTRKLMDEGKLIEAGWVGMRVMTLPEDAPPAQLEALRNAFFAGAHHVFASITSTLDEDDEPTEADYARMDSIQKELDEFIAGFRARIGQ